VCFRCDMCGSDATSECALRARASKAKFAADRTEDDPAATCSAEDSWKANCQSKFKPQDLHLKSCISSYKLCSFYG